MQKISNTNLLSIVMRLLVLILTAKFIALVVWWYLPSEGIEYHAKNSYQIPYQRVDFKNMLQSSKEERRSRPQEEVRQSSATNIGSLILKGLYGNSRSGYAIVAKKSRPKKTTIVAIGEVYEGYKLKAIELNQVVFTKGNKEYVLALEKMSDATYKKSVQKVTRSSNGEDAEYAVKKSDINYYSKNPSKIWKDIAISPLKRNGKIEGFKVKRIRKGSKMAQLGLQKGDVIIKANNIELTSFNDALKLYKNIDKLDTISLVVLRNNQEKEIIYEIH